MANLVFLRPSFASSIPCASLVGEVLSAAGSPFSQAPCFASWSYPELDSYVLAMYISSVIIPHPSETVPCPFMPIKLDPFNDGVHHVSDLGIAAEWFWLHQIM